MNKHVIFYVTAPNKKLALKIGKACIENKLVACVNIIDKVSSIYEWQGKICKENECILIMKSINKNSSKVIKKVKDLHSASCPCILSLPVLGGNTDFLKWILRECN